MRTLTFASIVSLIFTLILGPLVIKVTTKLHAGQNILKYVSLHKDKQGTPTMGGFIFLIPIVGVSLIFFNPQSKLGYLCLSVMLGYAIIGFLDDYIKIKYKHNEGLKPYQKIIAQFSIAVIVAIFCYKNFLVGDDIFIPFFNQYVSLSWWYIPFATLVFIATTNCVNLIDGLDGLAGSVSCVYAIATASMISILIYTNSYLSASVVLEQQNIILILIITASSLVGYLWFNSKPASIFMGDTGSLALGGLFASVALFSKTSLFILLFGIMFVFTGVSVILQVLHYKRTKKRIFLMAPYHHHLQMKGMYESKICGIYIIITFIISLITILLEMYLMNVN